MKEVRFMGEKIDTCRHGTWMDKGELNRIKKKFEAHNTKLSLVYKALKKGGKAGVKLPFSITSKVLGFAQKTTNDLGKLATGK